MVIIQDAEHIEILRKSQQVVGCLYPVLVDQDNKILSGRHRLFANKNWPVQQINVEDDLQRELVIFHANVQRTLSSGEMQHRLSRLAKILKGQGVPNERICARIAELVPYSEQWIRKNMDSEYKMKTIRGDLKKEKQVSLLNVDNEVKKVRTALLAMQQKSGYTDPFPFKECLCKGCPRRNECY